MIRKALFLSATVAAVALLAASPADARSAEVRRALACPSQTLGSVDVPADGATVSGYVVVKGYALDGNLVSNVDVYVDGTDDANRVTTAGGANINLPRPDILQAFPQYAGTPGSEPRLAGVLQGLELLERVAHDLRRDHGHVRLHVLPRAQGDQDRQREEPGAVRKHGLPAPEQLRVRQRRPHGRGLGARRPQGRPRRRYRRRAARAAGRHGHLPRRRRRELPGQPDRDRRGLHPERRLDALHQRRPHGQRPRCRRPGPAGLPRDGAGAGLQQRAEHRPLRRGRIPAPERELVRELLPGVAGRPVRRPDGHRRPAHHHVRQRLGPRGLAREHGRRLGSARRAGRRADQELARELPPRIPPRERSDRLLRVLPSRHRSPLSGLRAGAERRLPVLRRRRLPPHAEGLP